MGRSSSLRCREHTQLRSRLGALPLLGDEKHSYQPLNSRTALDAAMYFGNACHSALQPLARPTLGRNQPSPDPKALIPFHLLPGFPDVDHIHKALCGPALGLTSPLKRKASSCGVCRERVNSEAQTSSRYSGTRQVKMMKALDPPDSKIQTPEPVTKETTSQILPSPHSQSSSSDTTPEASASIPTSEAAASNRGSSESLKEPSVNSLPSSPGTSEKGMQKDGEGPETETEEEKAIRLLYCSLCKVAVNSASQLQAHNSGTKHKTMLEARSGDGAIKSFPRSGVKAKMAAPSESATGLQNKTFHCEICDVHVNSETQLKQHISSRRHKDRAAGKPAKPKFSPYTSTQRHHGLQAIRLTLLKNQEPNKPLAASLLQRHVSVAAALASLPHFSLQPATNSSPALFHAQPLPPALLHPGPGPICSPHTSVLFSPY
ncbi:zinc finger protein 385D-like [Cololabis saira]|uniref:zinc finger protein 385D-like n=1 Tax=Cololabis saira TaxID=129043 RepID=UPI002AD49337|nr:zinc finger protein 385D-like [Cololabis saira]XP_061597840.1 zinc finger protein 385D-like [Cololabis saira]